jgi:xanthine dehydrogenase YagS FAD-binding subunit
MTIEDVYRAAWSNARVHHSLGDADLILRVEVPAGSAGASHYLQVSERGAFDWALVSCAAAGRVERGRMKGVRLVVGAVSPTPWHVKAADDLLEGREPTAENVEKAIDRLLRDAVPQEHNGYKLTLARTLARRALAKLGAPSV